MAQNVEVEEAIKALRAQPGSEGYVLINFDGIPIRHDLDPKYGDPVQYAAQIADLVMKTKQTLKDLAIPDPEFVNLRMRTKQETEIIVTDCISNNQEYILVAIQDCRFNKKEEEVKEEEKV